MNQLSLFDLPPASPDADPRDIAVAIVDQLEATYGPKQAQLIAGSIFGIALNRLKNPTRTRHHS